MILDQPDLPRVGCPSSPAAMAAIFARTGWDCRRVSAAELAAPKTLQAGSPELLVLPQGAAFPVEAREAVEGYLMRGGNLLTTGGYAFNALVRKVDGRWISESERLAGLRRRAMRPEHSLLSDGGFERFDVPAGGFSNDGRWRCSGPHCRLVGDAPEGRRAFLCDLPKDRVAEGAHGWLDLPARPGATYEISARAKTEEVTGRGIAFAAVYQFDEAGRMVEFHDFVSLRGTHPWQTYRYAFTPKPQVRRLHVSLGFYEAAGKAWFDDVRLGDVTGLEERPMNTATGQPGDGLTVSPRQLGLFDADYRLRRVARVRTAAGQHVVQRPVELQGGFTGPAASGMIGRGAARWIPLLEAQDRYGRNRGPAAGMLVYFGGPYAGACLAYFGVDNVDLFAASGKPSDALGDVLAEIGRFMRRKTFLRDLKTGPSLIRAGERIAASVVVDNRGRAAVGARVEWHAIGQGGGDVAPVVARDMQLAAGAMQTLSVEFPAPRAGVPRVALHARLVVDNQRVDELSADVVVEDKSALRAAAALDFQKNYFTLGGRPTFLFGSDTYGIIYAGAGQGPAAWAEELAAARDIGVQLYEVLQPTPADCRVPESDWRSYAALNQLVHQRRMVFMPGMLIGRNVAIGDEELARESELCREYARRLGDGPSLLWYVNGDYALEISRRPDDVRRLWNRWLAERYGTREKLLTVWGDTVTLAMRAQRWGEFVYPPENSGVWDDAAAVDRAEFEAWLTARWNRSHVAALRSVAPRHPITSEYYSVPIGSLDLVRTIADQDVSNIGFFDPPGADHETLPLRICWSDLRVRGKGVSLGEYGVKTHPAWTEANGATGYHIVRSQEEQRRLFAAVAHYALGLGASKVQNWCLRDDVHWVFPWGMFYPNQLVPKDVAFLHRNQSLVWRFFAPVYRPPAICLGLANRLRAGNEDGLGTTAAYRATADLLALHYTFGTIDDDHLGELPPQTRVLLLPAPLAMTDDGFAKLVAWVRGGGYLVATGDFSRDEHRRPNRKARLRELAGIECDASATPLPARGNPVRETIDFSRIGLPPYRTAVHLRGRAVDGESLARRADGSPVLVRRPLGKGTVVYLASPIELDDGDDARAFRRRFYAAMLRDAAGRQPSAAGFAPAAIAPNDPRLHVLRQPTAQGVVHVVCNTRPVGGTTDVELTTAAGTVGLRVPDGWPALAAVGGDGRLVAAGSAGPVRCRGAVAAESTGLCTFLSLDGADLARSEAILVAPSAEGSVRFPGRSGQWTALVGEFCDGVWTMRERVEPADPAAPIVLDADRATCVTVYCRRDTEARWTELLSRAMTHPETLPRW